MATENVNLGTSPQGNMVIGLVSENTPHVLLSGVDAVTGLASTIVVADNSLRAIDWVHTRVHAGVMFQTGHYNSAVLTANSIEDLITVGSTKTLHAVFNLSAGGDAEAYLYEGTTVSSSGTAITPFDLNRTTANAVEGTFYHTPTISGVGTQLGPVTYIPGGIGGVSAGGVGGGPLRSGTEIILAVSTNYLLRLTNIAGTTQPLNIAMGFYEA